MFNMLKKTMPAFLGCTPAIIVLERCAGLVRGGQGGAHRERHVVEIKPKLWVYLRPIRSTSPTHD